MSRGEDSQSNLTKFKAVCGYCGWYAECGWYWMRPILDDHVARCARYDVKLYNKEQKGFDYANDTEKYLFRITFSHWFDAMKEIKPEEED